MNNNELLQKVKDEYARGLTFPDSEDHFKNWEIFVKFYKHMPCDFWDAHINAVSEAYHSARIAEVAKGECFTEDGVKYIDVKLTGPYHKPDEVLKYLNDKAAAFAAAKVEGMFTEEQVLDAIRMARRAFDGGNSFDVRNLFGSTEECTIGIDFSYSEEEIINQLKEK